MRWVQQASYSLSVCSALGMEIVSLGRKPLACLCAAVSDSLVPGLSGWGVHHIGLSGRRKWFAAPSGTSHVGNEPALPWPEMSLSRRGRISRHPQAGASLSLSVRRGERCKLQCSHVWWKELARNTWTPRLGWIFLFFQAFL